MARRTLAPFLLLFLFSFLSHAHPASTYRFTNIAKNPATSGLYYRRTPSRTNAEWNRRLSASLTAPFSSADLLTFPVITHGQPGVAVGDFNQDGWDDIYVTNGPGAPNSLFINHYPKEGTLRFADEASEFNVEAIDQDSSGVCYGDLNSDGVPDIVVLSGFDSNILFLSSNGTYQQVLWELATGDTELYPSASCSIGDVDNDGKLDIVIANGMSKEDFTQCAIMPFSKSSANQIFLNNGRTRDTPISFEDATVSSRINEYGGSVPPGGNLITWAIALVDMNLDGNLDVVVANDQCGLPTLAESPTGANRGRLYVQYGDGEGHFNSTVLLPVEAEKNFRHVAGAESWMGLGFGDFNCDGQMDLFGSNFGDYSTEHVSQLLGFPFSGKVGEQSSRWWLGQANGFRDASIEETGATTFGWGNAVLDYDNDGDQDIFMVGALDFHIFAGSDNPNVIYKNENCSAKFTYDIEAWEPSGTVRNYQGFAMGDFNQDGYPDVVGASGYLSKKSQLVRSSPFGSLLDATAFFTPVVNQSFSWTGNRLEKGTLMVEINKETDKSKCWVSVLPIGMKGMIRNGKVNHGALGARLIMRPKGMPSVMTPIIGGESFGSQHSARRNFGLGHECEGDLEIVWPQGMKNRLYGLRHGEVLTIPEIPCGFDFVYDEEQQYKRCVIEATWKMTKKGIIARELASRLRQSALKARREFLAQYI